MAAFQGSESFPGTGRKELNTGFAAYDNPITGSATYNIPDACASAYTRANNRSDVDGNAPSDSHCPAAGY